MSIKKRVVLVCLILLTAWDVGAFENGTQRQFTNSRSIYVTLFKDYSKFTMCEIKLSVSGNKSDYVRVKPDDGKYHYGRVVSSKGKALGYFRTDMSIVLCSDYYDPKTKKMSGGCQKIDTGNIELRIPFFPDGSRLEIFNPQGRKILTADISSLASRKGQKIRFEGWQRCGQRREAPKG